MVDDFMGLEIAPEEDFRQESVLIKIASAHRGGMERDIHANISMLPEGPSPLPLLMILTCSRPCAACGQPKDAKSSVYRGLVDTQMCRYLVAGQTRRDQWSQVRQFQSFHVISS
jgi:hypothetical protein